MIEVPVLGVASFAITQFPIFESVSVTNVILTKEKPHSS